MNVSDIPGIGDKTASLLRAEAGIEDVEDLANADADELGSLDGVTASRAEEWVNKANESTVIIQPGTEVAAEYEDLYRVPTGVDKLDDVLGGGWESGFLVALAGETGAGKTQLAYQALGEAVKDTGDPAVYIETERGRYRGKRITEMYDESVQAQVYKAGAYDLDQQRMAYEKVRSQFDDISCVVVDSFTARFRLSDKFEGRESLSQRSTEFAAHLTNLERLAAEKNVPILLTCQVYGNPGGYGSSVQVYGGSLMKHTVNFICMLHDRQGALMELEIRNHPNVEETKMDLRVTQEGVESV